MTHTTPGADQDLSRTRRTRPGRTTNHTVVDDAVPLWRLYLLRVGYLVFGGGLAVVKWPMLLHRDQWTLTQGVIDCMLIALSGLALLGLRVWGLEGAGAAAVFSALLLLSGQAIAARGWLRARHSGAVSARQGLS